VTGKQAGWLLHRAANCLHERGQYQQAWPVAERALRVTEAAVGPAEPEVAWRRDGLGAVLRRLGDLAGAKSQLERAVAISEAALGPDHPDVANWRSHLGSVLRDLGIWREPGHRWSGHLRSARRRLGPTTRMWSPSATTSAACCRPLKMRLLRVQPRLSSVVAALGPCSGMAKAAAPMRDTGLPPPMLSSTYVAA